MPLYQYECDKCGNFDQMQKIAKASDSVACPDCSQLARRSIVATYLGCSARNTIMVAGRNERAQNEPSHSSELGHANKGSHCCPSKSNRISSKTMSNRAGDKMFPTMRPWMISH